LRKASETAQQTTQLSGQQLEAAALLAAGKTDEETARAVGVTQEAVAVWRSQNPYFVAELNERKKDSWNTAHDRLRGLATKAVDALEKALEDGDTRAAVEVLKAVGLYGNVNEPAGETDAELVLWRQAKDWARTELARRGPSGSKICDLLGNDEEEAVLAHRRMKELKKALKDAR